VRERGLGEDEDCSECAGEKKSDRDEKEERGERGMVMRRRKGME
jgi:hypothetical protein